VNVLANILLLVATVATVILGSFFASTLPYGPGRAGIGIQCVMLQTPRWICLAVVLGMCVAKGAFTWPPDRGAQYFIVFVVHALLGLGCIVCGVVAMEGLRGVPVPEWMIRSLAFAALVIPATEILFAGWFLNPGLRNALDAARVRVVINYALLCFGVTVLGFGAVGAAVFQRNSSYRTRQRAESAARAKAQAEAEASAEEQAFRALTPQSSLNDWLRFTEYSHAEAYRKAAREAILKRPTLAQDLSTGIASTNAEDSMKLMYFVGELPSPPVEVAEAVRGKARWVVQIAQEIDPAAANSRDLLYEKAHNIAAGVSAAAFGLQRAGVNITGELQAMANACRDREKVPPRDIAENCERIIQYLATPESKQPVH
jgi:hypothetical protein